MEKIVKILIFTLFAGNIYAQTEIPELVTDTAQQIEIEIHLPKNGIENLLRNPHPTTLLPTEIHADSLNKYEMPLKLETEKFFPKSSMEGLLRNPYPTTLPIEIYTDSLSTYKMPFATARKDTILFVRSAFYTGESPLFGNLPIKKRNDEIIITLNIKREEETPFWRFINKLKKFSFFLIFIL